MTSCPPVEALAAMLSPSPPISVIPVGRGGNNRLYRIETDQGLLALKLYPRIEGDQRDRLATEFGALRFLAQRGVDSIPTALAADLVAGAALYSWVDGVVVADPGDSELDQAVAFVARLKTFCGAEGAERLPLASEACLSGEELIRQISARLARLLQLSHRPVLSEFLTGEVAPLLAKHALIARTALRDSHQDISMAKRSLSPSDFGFHNALRMADGRMVFLDFEYFGWDDPVKLVADTLLHPGMNLSEVQGRRFLDGVEVFREADPGFDQRLEVLFPLYALRWSLIVLNEFLPERWARRVAAGELRKREVVEDQQLEKARQLLARTSQLL